MIIIALISSEAAQAQNTSLPVLPATVPYTKVDPCKRTIMMRLHLLGWTQDEISGKLKELYPDASGTSLRTVKSFSAEFGKLRELHRSDYESGHEVSTIAKRHVKLLNEIIALLPEWFTISH